MTDPGMKCTRCREPASHRFPSHNVRFCDGCLEVYIQRQVERAIEKFSMLEPGQRVLVAISGGKDSAVLWKVLHDLGYDTEAVHLVLDLGEFTDRSLEACQAMAGLLGRPLHLPRFSEMSGFTMNEIVRVSGREFCSVCGTMKRHFLNKFCLSLGMETVATGHHLDDEAGRLLGNLVRRQRDYLDAMWPTLEGIKDKLARKVKPLCRLDSEELQAYGETRGLPIAYGACPKSKGATLPYYQEAVGFMEGHMPGTKRNMYFGFLRDKGGPPPDPVAGGECSRCGSVSRQEVCATCRLLARAQDYREHGPLKRPKPADQAPPS